MKYKDDIKDRTKRFAVATIKKAIQLKEKRVEFVLRNQFLRSGTSVGANVKEAKASSSRKELIRFYEIALRSANETEFWVEAIEDGYEFEKEIFVNEKKELEEISKIIGSIVINLKKQSL